MCFKNFKRKPLAVLSDEHALFRIFTPFSGVYVGTIFLFAVVTQSEY